MNDQPPRPPSDLAAQSDLKVEQGAEHHRAGRLDDAERLYREVLDADPAHWRAAHNLGALFLQRKDLGQALPLLQRAVETETGGRQAWAAYAQALIAADRFEEAERVLDGRGDDPRGQGLSLRLRQAWGMALRKAGRLKEAKRQFELALELAPEDAHAHGDLGYVELQLGNAEAGEARLRRAVELSPNDAVLLMNYGSALRSLGRNEEAEDIYRQVFDRDPSNHLAVQNLVYLLMGRGRYEDALALAERVEAGLGLHLAASIRGEALCGLGRYEEALAVFDALEAERPGVPQVRYRRAQARLLLCDFEGGWKDWESRWRMDFFLRDSGSFVVGDLVKRLDLTSTADDLKGMRVLLLAEQGVGDEVMFASMIPDLARIASVVVCVCQAKLNRLFSNSFPQVRFYSPPHTPVRLEDFDVVLAMGSLGRLFRNSLADFPRTPYLKPRPAVIDAWRERLGPKRGALRVGVSWRGGTKTTRVNQRSLDLRQLEPVLSLPDCEFVNLQYGDVADEVAAANDGRANSIRLFPPEEINDFEDLAGLLANLDVVVSVQTSLVHLCGATGTDCLTLIPRQAEWRYTARSSTMPWYGSVRLFRRAEAESWEQVVERVAETLRQGAR